MSTTATASWKNAREEALFANLESCTEIQVAGQIFHTRSCMVMRCTYARRAEDGFIFAISSSGYIRNERTVRKAIASTLGLASFRK